MGGSASRSGRERSGFDRRGFLKLSAAVAATPALAGLTSVEALAGPQPSTSDVEVAGTAVEEATIRQLQNAMSDGVVTSRSLVETYIQRIRMLDRRGPNVNSVLQLNPDAKSIAQALDEERADGNVRGPLHGIPILLKDNIDTNDKMQTTAGSLALVGDPAPQDATVADRLREAGAVVLGKANLSEWANFRGFSSSSGWSGRGGQTLNPYVLDRNPCGSSAGSAAAVAANFVTVSLGTETDGSIVCPSHQCGVVGIKPTVGLTSRAGVVPISHTQDTVGPHGRTVADAATVLGALVGVDPRDPATDESAGNFHTDYRPFLDKHGLQGARIGVVRSGVTGYSEETDQVFEDALQAMQDAGAVLVDPADIPTIDQINAGAEEIAVLIYEFKRDLRAYLQGRTGVPVHNLADIIAFNNAHRFTELRWFGQQLMELAQANVFSQQEYLDAREEAHRIGGPDGIDAVLTEHTLDALVAPTGAPAWPNDLVNGDHFLGASSGPAAIAGYPLINVPAGHSFGLPVGITFMGTAWSEPTLIKIASGFEAVTHARRKPEFRTTLDRGFSGPDSSASAATLRRPSRETLRVRRPSVTGL